MKKKRGEIENRFHGLAPPELPAGLKERTLTAACVVLDRPGSRDWWSELWWSRPLRYAWGAAVLLLLIGHLIVPGYLASAGAPVPSPVAAALRDERAELAELVALPPIDASWRSLSELIPEGMSPYAKPKSADPLAKSHKGGAS